MEPDNLDEFDDLPPLPPPPPDNPQGDPNAGSMPNWVNENVTSMPAQIGMDLVAPWTSTVSNLSPLVEGYPKIKNAVMGAAAGLDVANNAALMSGVGTIPGAVMKGIGMLGANLTKNKITDAVMLVSRMPTFVTAKEVNKGMNSMAAKQIANKQNEISAINKSGIDDAAANFVKQNPDVRMSLPAELITPINRRLELTREIIDAEKQMAQGVGAVDRAIATGFSMPVRLGMGAGSRAYGEGEEEQNMTPISMPEFIGNK